MQHDVVNDSRVVLDKTAWYKIRHYQPKIYSLVYGKGIEDGTISNKTTRNQYIYNRWFKEQYLPSEGLTYSGKTGCGHSRCGDAI